MPPRVDSETTSRSTHRWAGRGWASAAVAVCVLALGLVGVGLAGIARQDVEASVTVTFTKTSLVVQHRHLQAGPAQFVVANRAPKLQVLTISGPGLKTLTRKVAPGKSSTLTVTLRKGVYMVSARAGRAVPAVRWLVVGPSSSSSSSSREVQPFPDPVPQECD